MSRDAQIDRLITQAISARLFPGLELLVFEDGHIAIHKVWGTRSGHAADPLIPSAIFDLASLTKPVATASVLAALVERGRLSLDDRVARHLPEFGKGEKARITLRDLAGHASGLAASVPLYQRASTPDAGFKLLCDMSLERPPRSEMIYSCMGYLVLGAVLERVTGQSLPTLFDALIARPLGLDDTMFTPRERGIPATRLVPSVPDDSLVGIVHDDNSRLFAGKAGNAGLFSTASDLLTFARMLLAAGRHKDRQVLSAETVALFFTNLNPPELTPRTLGWEVVAPGAPTPSCGPALPAGAIGHTGFTGTSMWIDPQAGRVAIALSNRTWYSHRETLPEVVAFRRRLHGLIWHSA